MYDVRIFSTFYIRTKLDFLLYQLSSLFFSIVVKCAPWRALSTLFAFHFYFAHTLTFTRNHMQRSKLHPHIYLDLSFFFVAWPEFVVQLTYCKTQRAFQAFYLSSEMKIPLCLYSERIS